jgi:hypothetical protein
LQAIRSLQKVFENSGLFHLGRNIYGPSVNVLLIILNPFHELIRLSWAIDAVDRTLRDIKENQRPFGGCTMVFVGDMQQLLPIHRFAKDPAAYCLKMCDWYPWATILQLTVNVRVDDDTWAHFVAQIGAGSSACFPNHCNHSTEDDLIEAVWPNNDFAAPGLRSVLTMTREDCHRINNKIMERFHICQTHTSHNTVHVTTFTTH